MVSSADKFNAAAVGLLPKPNFSPVIIANSVAEARRMLVGQTFDINIVHSPMPDEIGMRLAIDTCSTSSASVLILAKAELYNDIYAKAVDYGVMTLSKPTSIQTMAQTLHIMCATRERMRQAEAKQASVEDKMQEIRLVNRAKWLLIECLNMSEADAHRYIEMRAMKERVTKREIAEASIETYK